MLLDTSLTSKKKKGFQSEAAHNDSHYENNE